MTRTEKEREVYISVDIEASGPIPGTYSMLSLGAALVADPDVSFYVELKPISKEAVPEALEVSGFDLEELERSGTVPEEAMRRFSAWIEEVVQGRKAVLVGFNASFDWAFVNWYFHMYLGENPFGIGALDIKAYYMGLAGCAWGETTSSQLPEQLKPPSEASHHALDDAQHQGEIFARLLDLKEKRPNSPY